MRRRIGLIFFFGEYLTMPMSGQRAFLECCGCPCPCCPGWPGRVSAIIHWTSEVLISNDCELAPSIISLDGDFGCPGDRNDEEGTVLRTAATELRVRVFCESNGEDFVWRVQYRSAVSGEGFVSPSSPTWADADFVFVCPNCAAADDNGSAHGTIDFVAIMACETSGGIVSYEVKVHGDVEIGCRRTSSSGSSSGSSSESI